MTLRSFRFVFPFLVAFFSLVSGAAFAHPGHVWGGQGDFTAGLMHPLSGLDHMLAMMAVGAWAFVSGGRTRLWAPASFLVVMALGAGAGIVGLGHAPYEAGIAASVVVMGLILALAWQPSLGVVCAVSGLCALLHGHAHGVEMGAFASPVPYGVGFLLASSSLMAAGAGLAAVMRRRQLAAVGACVAVAGFALLIV